VEVAPQVRVLPRKSTAQVQQFGANGTVVHYSRAKHEELAYIGSTVEREAARFIGKDEFVRHCEAQIEKFRDLARELECDESEGRFTEALKEVAKALLKRRHQKSRTKSQGVAIKAKSGARIFPNILVSWFQAVWLLLPVVRPQLT
jgi:hypothetical protein